MDRDDAHNIEGATINTEGGALITGVVEARDFVGRDRITFISEETAYDARGRENPYLGLGPYTYAERERYAGRAELVAQTVRKLTSARPRPLFLFITGASGCGKSSFAQAGLLPALEQVYTELHFPVGKAVFRPSHQPLDRLAEALQQLGLAVADGLFAPAVAKLELFPVHAAPDNQISLLVIDQFEELFTQSDATERETLLDLLAALPPFAELRMHIIATLRSDYLPEVYAYKAIYDLTKDAVDLRAMTVDQIKLAITQPLLHLHPDAGIRFEDALLDRLARDAAADPTYLPLLQVTLEDLWAGGELRLSHYQGLAAAIQTRAEEVLTKKEAAPDQIVARDEKEQTAILEIFLDLVTVSLDDNPRGDVRKRRRIDALVEDRPLRKPLIYELSNRRLLATAVELDPKTEQNIEVVDIIHEALLNNWPRLQAAISEHRERLQRRSRFELALNEWKEADRAKQHLLQGLRLAEAKEMALAGDVALQADQDAHTFLAESVAQESAAQRRRRNTTIAVIAVLSLLLVVAVITALMAAQAGGLARVEADRAVRARNLAQSQAQLARQQSVVAEEARARAVAESQRARSGELAALSVAELENDPELSILLALEAISMDEGEGAESALRRAIQKSSAIVTFTHSIPIYALAFSPDGNRLMTADDRELHIWDTHTYQRIDSWNAHNARTIKLVYHPYGIQVATANQNRDEAFRAIDIAIRLWDPTTGTITHLMTDHQGTIYDLDYNVDGTRLASGSADGTARIWNTGSGELMATLPMTGSILSVDFSPDGAYLATAGTDGVARIWDLESQRVSYAYTRTRPISSIAFSPDGKLLAFAGHDFSIELWDSSEHEQRRGVINGGHTDAVWDMDFSADGKRLVSAGLEGAAIIWDVSNLSAGVAEIKRLMGHQGAITGVDYDPLGLLVATGGNDSTVRLWSAAAHQDWIIDLAFDPVHPERFVTASTDHQAKIWEFAAGRFSLLKTLDHLDQVRRAVYSPDGLTIATASSDGKGRLWDAQTGQLRRELAGHTDAITSIAFGRGGALLGTASRDQTARIWDTQTGAVLHVLAGHDAWVNDIAFSPDGAIVVTTSSRAGDRHGRVTLWRVEDGALLTTLAGHTGDVESAMFSPNGRWLATTATDLTVQLWDVATGQAVHRLAAHTDRIFGLAFDSASQRLVTAGNDGRVLIWHVPSGIQEKVIIDEPHPVFTVSLSPDDRFILMGDLKGQLHAQAITVADLRQQAIERLTRWWRPAECDKYLRTPVCPPPP